MLDVVGLRDRALFPAAALPYGVQKRVELARALVAKPRLLLLDEPAGGLNHEEVSELGAFIKRIRDDFEPLVLLVEHHMNLVMSISDDVNVLSFGTEDRERAPAQVQADPGGSRRTSAPTTSTTPTSQPSEPRQVSDAKGDTESEDEDEDAARARRCRRPVRTGPGPHRRVPRRPRGRGRRRPRRERRREDDDAARDLGHGAPAHGRDRARREGAQGWAGGGREDRNRARPRGARHLRRSHGDREPQARRVHAPRPLGEGGHQASIRVLPLDGRARRPARGDALRRRAADARARPGALRAGRGCSSSTSRRSASRR